LQLKGRCDELGITNIEELLTAVTLAQSVTSNTRVTALVEELVYGDHSEVQRISAATRRPATRRAGTELVASLSDSSQALFSVLVGIMKDRPPNAVHTAIATRARSNLDTVITTNYDVCLERAFGEGQYNYRLEPLATVAASRGLDAATMIKLHGSL